MTRKKDRVQNWASSGYTYWELDQALAAIKVTRIKI
jgi:hypothetical protein